jgi:hypothetical protein
MRSPKIFEKMNYKNKGNRLLLESIPVPEVNNALNDWIYYSNEGILIGGCAVSFHGRPRMTMDVDILFLNADDIPKNVTNFKRIRQGSFQHNKTHVEIEVLSPSSINISQELAEMIFKTSVRSNNFTVASPSGIVALKLQRGSFRDKADIVDMIKTNKVDLTGWPLSDEQFDTFLMIKHSPEAKL